ncbi:MAG: sulfite exporter TauE/SafE family protein, partial [Brachybacterium sp.]
IGSTYGYRREIAQEKGNLAPLVSVTALCATLGALLLLVSPARALDVVVPVLIVVALAMVLFQKRLTMLIRGGRERRNARRQAASQQSAPAAESSRSPYRGPGLLAAMGGASVYGGYFTAAQGVLYLGILGIFTGRSMGSVNSIKNLLSLVVNLAAAIVYVIAHFVLGVEIVWLATAAIAVGALLGGYFGAHLAKRMPEWLLRGIIVVVALAALVRQVL